MWISKKKYKEIESRLSALEHRQRAVIQEKGKLITSPKRPSSTEDRYNHDTHKHQ